ncbi:hypothetical protein TNCV_4811991 [Trichonephila clavipes]|nr:hypothetical protein TNCV_4811991 [Trichonephila clavipes]
MPRDEASVVICNSAFGSGSAKTGGFNMAKHNKLKAQSVTNHVLLSLSQEKMTPRSRNFHNTENDASADRTAPVPLHGGSLWHLVFNQRINIISRLLLPHLQNNCELNSTFVE